MFNIASKVPRSVLSERHDFKHLSQDNVH